MADIKEIKNIEMDDIYDFWQHIEEYGHYNTI